MSVNYSNKNPFDSFIAQTGAYSPVSLPAFVPSSISSSIPTVNASSQPPLAQVKIGDLEADKFETEKDKKHKHVQKIYGIIGASVGSALLVGVLAFAALSKGFSGSISKQLIKISDRAKKTVFDLKSKSKDLTPSQKVLLKINKGIQTTADYLQATSNFTAIKDSTLSHFANKLKLQPLVNSINKFFKKITLKTKNQAYNEAEYSTVDFCNYLKKVAKEKNNPDLEKKANQIMQDYSQMFSSEKHISRAQNAWEDMNGLDETVFSELFGKGGIFRADPKRLRKYVTTELISKDKNALQNQLLTAKAGISNDLADVEKALKTALNDLKTNINTQDQLQVDLVSKLSKQIEEGSKLTGATEDAARQKLFGEIHNNLTILRNKVRSSSVDEKSLKTIEEKITKFESALKPEAYSKGDAQQALTTIKEIYGKDSKEYKTAQNFVNNMNSNLNSAIEKEVIAYEKLAELRVGSAPMDILGILGPAALAGYMVASSKDKDERISKTLNAGIPIFGGIGMAYYGTLRGFTGVKNLIIGTVTSLLLGVIGSQTDKMVKNYRNEQHDLREAFESFKRMKLTQQSAGTVKNNA